MNMAKELGASLFSGIVIKYFPDTLKSMMGEYLGKAVFSEVVAKVNENGSLWEMLPEKYQRTLIEYGPKLGKIEWFTLEWVLDSGRESAPSLYGYFSCQPEAMEWLGRQVEEIKNNIIKGGRNA